MNNRSVNHYIFSFSKLFLAVFYLFFAIKISFANERALNLLKKHLIQDDGQVSLRLDPNILEFLKKNKLSYKVLKKKWPNLILKRVRVIDQPIVPLATLTPPPSPSISTSTSPSLTSSDTEQDELSEISISCSQRSTD